MGKNEEEQGSLLLPSAAVLKLRNALNEAMNQQQMEWLELATKIHAHLKSDAGKQDRKDLGLLLRSKPTPNAHSIENFIQKKITQFAPKPIAHSRFDSHYDPDDYYRQWAIQRLLLTEAKPGELRKIQAPKKKDLEILPSKNCRWNKDACSVSIDPETRVLNWYVDRSKNAVDEAWAGLLGKTLDKALKQVTWTRGTGGVFNYCDEYAQDAAMDHGYNPVSISRSYGPLGENIRNERSGFPSTRTRRIGNHKSPF